MTQSSDSGPAGRASPGDGKPRERLAALKAMLAGSNAALDLRTALHFSLDLVVRAVEADAGAILLLNPETRTLDFAALQGLQAAASGPLLGEGFAGRAALERRAIGISNLQEEPLPASQVYWAATEAFSGYNAQPLINLGAVKGVLEIFYRAGFQPDVETQAFLETAAEHLALTIQSGQLFELSQQSQLQLVVSVEAAMETLLRLMRDCEPEGHPERVAEMTLRVAQAIGVADSDLVHLRRGALLHDLGLLGVPESILRKTEPLDDDERARLNQHPVHACELLSPIAALEPALQIPYCHHERWDGTGYPRGLKGSEIPLAARIFAVVDAWDEMCTLQPGRPALAADPLRAQLQARAGTHFDPAMVEAFLRII
jgi:GAF domain-containing protein